MFKPMRKAAKSPTALRNPGLSAKRTANMAEIQKNSGRRSRYQFSTRRSPAPMTIAKKNRQKRSDCHKYGDNGRRGYGRGQAGGESQERSERHGRQAKDGHNNFAYLRRPLPSQGNSSSRSEKVPEPFLTSSASPVRTPSSQAATAVTKRRCRSRSEEGTTKARRSRRMAESGATSAGAAASLGEGRAAWIFRKSPTIRAASFR